MNVVTTVTGNKHSDGFMGCINFQVIVFYFINGCSVIIDAFKVIKPCFALGNYTGTGSNCKNSDIIPLAFRLLMIKRY